MIRLSEEGNLVVWDVYDIFPHKPHNPMNFIARSYYWPKSVKTIVALLVILLMAVLSVLRSGGEVLSFGTLEVFGRFVFTFCCIHVIRSYYK